MKIVDKATDVTHVNSNIVRQALWINPHCNDVAYCELYYKKNQEAMLNKVNHIIKQLTNKHDDSNWSESLTANFMLGEDKATIFFFNEECNQSFREYITNPRNYKQSEQFIFNHLINK